MDSRRLIALAQCAAFTLVAVATCAQEEGRNVTTRPPDKSAITCLGVFGASDQIWERGERLSDYHINAVFVGHGSLTRDLVTRCHREGAKVYAEFGVFMGASLADEYPELWPINAEGDPQQKDEWYLGLCPTVEWHREAKLERVREVAAEFEIDGLWLDFIRFPGHWEMHPPRLEQGCFNDSCLEAFTEATGVELPPGTNARKAEFILNTLADEWTAFKCDLIRDFCRQAGRILKEERPDALLGAFVVPWTDENYDDAIHSIIAQDFTKLADTLDVFTPMSYHAMCGWPVESVGEFNEYLTDKTGRDVWPIVQATERDGRYEDAPVDAGEFREALTQGLSGGASGVLMFRLADCTDTNEKLQVIKEVYGELAE